VASSENRSGSEVASGGRALPKQDVLPFPPTPSASRAGRTMQESSYENRVKERRLPEDAPNILIVLIDDAGPGLPDTFGGEVRTDTLSRVRGEGIGFNRFHTTAMCSPTRASLMTGRNHHRIGNGQIAELANDWDGYAGEIPKSSALGAEVLKQYGYATAAFGKWHNTPAIETTAAGPFHNWPSEIGFEYFYGFLAGEASQYESNLVRNTTSVLPPGRRRRAITSARTSPMTRSAGCSAIRPSSPTSHSSCTGRPAACTHPIT
jgi:arylsulfatase A-like enzyme